MAQLFAALLGLTALSASILAGVDSVSSLTRGGIALAVGWVAGSIWDVSLGRMGTARNAPALNEMAAADQTGGLRADAVKGVEMKQGEPRSDEANEQQPEAA